MYRKAYKMGTLDDYINAHKRVMLRDQKWDETLELLSSFDDLKLILESLNIFSAKDLVKFITKKYPTLDKDSASYFENRLFNLRNMLEYNRRVIEKPVTISISPMSINVKFIGDELGVDLPEQIIQGTEIDLTKIGNRLLNLDEIIMIRTTILNSMNNIENMETGWWKNIIGEYNKGQVALAVDRIKHSDPFLRIKINPETQLALFTQLKVIGLDWAIYNPLGTRRHKTGIIKDRSKYIFDRAA